MKDTSTAATWGRVVETRRFRRDASAPARVRRLVSRHTCGGEGSDAALLAASEITTNAVRYGEPGVPDLLEATVSCQGTALTLEVTGRGAFAAGPSGERRRSGSDVGGFGLALVEAVSSDWGIDQQRGRRVRVWFTVDGVTQRRRRNRG